MMRCSQSVYLLVVVHYIHTKTGRACPYLGDKRPGCCGPLRSVGNFKLTSSICSTDSACPTPPPPLSPSSHPPTVVCHFLCRHITLLCIGRPVIHPPANSYGFSRFINKHPVLINTSVFIAQPALPKGVMAFQSALLPVSRPSPANPTPEDVSRC